MILPSIINAATSQCLKNTLSVYQPLISVTAAPWICMHQVRFAKRKGMRMRQEQARRKKAKEMGPKKEEEKIFIPYKTILAQRSTSSTRRYNVDHWLKTPPIDDVWQMQFYKIREYTVSHALDLIRQTHHPTVYNKPDALIYLTVELDMKLPKKNKYMDNFSSIVELLHIYDNAPVNRVIAVTKNEDEQVEAVNRGAILSGYKDILQQIKTGDISGEDYDYILASHDIIRDLIPLKGILRQRFPTLKNKMACFNLLESVFKFTNGFPFASKKDNFEHDFGWVDVTCGQLTMTNDELLENIHNILKAINEYKPPNTEWPFITRIRIMSPPSTEKYDISGESEAEEMAKEEKQTAAA